MNTRTKNRGRMTIYAMAGVYLLFMAYNLMKSLPGSSGNEKILMAVFMVFFAVVGAGMVIGGLVAAYRIGKAPDTEENADTEENPATDENPEENNGEE